MASTDLTSDELRRILEIVNRLQRARSPELSAADEDGLDLGRVAQQVQPLSGDREDGRP